jgi:hypothetical protein
MPSSRGSRLHGAACQWASCDSGLGATACALVLSVLYALAPTR